ARPGQPHPLVPARPARALGGAARLGVALPARRLPVHRAARRSGRRGVGRPRHAGRAGRDGGGVGAPDRAAAGWEVVHEIPGVQLVDAGVAAEPDPGAMVLGPSDVPEMLALVERTRPGPFLPRTVEMGTYLGIRHDGELVAMAGERLHPPGWTASSAVRTDPPFPRPGLATRLVPAGAPATRARGETPA